jgi:hypothetical protein
VAGKELTVEVRLDGVRVEGASIRIDLDVVRDVLKRMEADGKSPYRQVMVLRELADGLEANVMQVITKEVVDGG